MSAAAAQILSATDETAEAAAIVERFLIASMVPDPETAARYIADESARYGKLIRERKISGE